MIVLLFVLFLPSVYAVCDVCTLATGECTTLESTGVLCLECSYRGYVDSSIACVCISPYLNPSNSCLSLSDIPAVETQFNITYGEASCACNETFEYGMWAASTPPPTSLFTFDAIYLPEFKYGMPEPSVCDECYNQYIGPKPETITASDVSFDILACTQIGGPDPLLPLTPAPTISNDEYETRRRLDIVNPTISPWYVCSGHGNWTENNTCDCNTGWGLRLLDERGPASMELYTCDICVGPYGPPTPRQQDSSPLYAMEYGPFCQIPYTPDPIDGALKFCSGHGDFERGECVCYDNSTHGNWTLSNYTLTEEVWAGIGYQEYGVEVIDFTVETCIGCNYGYDLETGCLDRTESPTLQPTVPTKSPTASPTKSPTASPTVPTSSPTAPTSSPTSPTNSPTKSPTRSPTTPTGAPAAADAIVMWITPSTYTGSEVGTRSNSVGICTLSYPPELGPVSNSHIQSVLSYPSGDTFANTQTAYAFPSTMDIISIAGTLISNGFPSLIGGTPSALVSPIATVFGVPNSEHWTGSTPTGGVAPSTCNGWTSNSPAVNGAYGVKNSNAASWLSFNPTACNVARNFLCIAIPVIYTRSPTVPTKSPTSPTGAPATANTIVMWAAPGTYTGSQVGNRDNSVNTICAPSYPPQLGPVSTAVIQSVLSYTGDLFSSTITTYGFPSTMDVTNTAGELIANDFPTLISGTPTALLSPIATRLGIPSSANSHWTAATATGGLAPTTCLDFTSSSPADSGMSGASNVITGAWLSSGFGSTCNNARRVLCIALPPAFSKSPTAMPTVPTNSPTSSPTSPTSSPTSPTNSPTSPTSSPTSPTSSPTAPTSSPTAPTSSPTSPTSSPTAPTSSPTAPTSSPTSPTSSPTSPTSSPTAPTSSPTSPTGAPATADALVMWATPSTYTGSQVGDRANSVNTVCAPSYPPQLGPISTAVIQSVLSYTGDPFSDTITTYGFPTTMDVMNAAGTLISNDFPTLISNTPTALVSPISVTLGIPSLTDSHWTGTSATGSTSPVRCTDFTSSSPGVNGMIGSSASNGGAWLASGFGLPCNVAYRVLCIAIPPAYSKSPTSSPTTRSPTAPTSSPTSPTNSPTAPTNSPTKSPTSSPTVPGILDALSSGAKSDARGLYALQRYYGAFAGPAWRCRRASDNVEEDFYALTILDVANARTSGGTTLTSWLGGSTCYLRTWYDQSGNARDATQTTAANQAVLDVANNWWSFSPTSVILEMPDGTVRTGSPSSYTILYQIGTLVPSAPSAFRSIVKAGTCGTPSSNIGFLSGYSTNPTPQWAIDFWGLRYTWSASAATGDIIITQYDGTNDNGWVNGGYKNTRTHPGTLVNAPATQFIGGVTCTPIYSYPMNGPLYYVQIYGSGTMSVSDLSIASQTTVLSDTKSPTKSPTRSPTVPTSSPTAPTKSPTVPTSSPTAPTSSPTAPTSSPTSPTNAPVIATSAFLYMTSSTYSVAQLGTRVLSSEVCVTEYPPSAGPTSAVMIVSVLSYSGDSLANILAITGVPSTMDIVNIAGTVVSNDVPTFLGNTPTALNTPIATAMGVPSPTQYWTGTLGDGTTSPNTCRNWDSTAPSPTFLMQVGDASVTSGSFLAGTTAVCSSPLKLLCIAIPSAQQSEVVLMYRQPSAVTASGLLTATCQPSPLNTRYTMQKFAADGSVVPSPTVTGFGSIMTSPQFTSLDVYVYAPAGQNQGKAVYMAPDMDTVCKVGQTSAPSPGGVIRTAQNFLTVTGGPTGRNTMTGFISSPTSSPNAPTGRCTSPANCGGWVSGAPTVTVTYADYATTSTTLIGTAPITAACNSPTTYDWYCAAVVRIAPSFLTTLTTVDIILRTLTPSPTLAPGVPSATCPSVPSLASLAPASAQPFYKNAYSQTSYVCAALAGSPTGSCTPTMFNSIPLYGLRPSSAPTGRGGGGTGVIIANSLETFCKVGTSPSPGITTRITNNILTATASPRTTGIWTGWVTSTGPFPSPTIAAGNCATNPVTCGPAWNTPTPSLTQASYGLYDAAVTSVDNLRQGDATCSVPSANAVVMCDASMPVSKSDLNGVGLPPSPAILDTMSSTSLNAARGLYALQRVLSTYGGPVVKLRRSSDNVEADFYARTTLSVANMTTIDEINLISWMGASTNVFVTTWYDQSGRSNNAVQATTANQPRLDIYNNAVLFTTGSTSFLTMPSGTLETGAITTYTVALKHGYVSPTPSGVFLNSGNPVPGTTNAWNGFTYSPTQYGSTWYANDVSFGTMAAGNDVVWTYSGTTRSIFVSGVPSTSSPSTGINVSPGTQYIGIYNPSAPLASVTMNGQIYYISILGNSVPTDDRYKLVSQGIPAPSPAAILDSMTFAGRSKARGLYSLQRLYGNYTGPTFKARRAVDDVEADFFCGVNLAVSECTTYNRTTTLLQWAGPSGVYMTTWYDQSGSGRHATQTTAASQPLVVIPDNVIKFTPTAPTYHWLDIPDNTIPTNSPNAPYTLAARHYTITATDCIIFSGNPAGALNTWNVLRAQTSPAVGYENDWYSNDYLFGSTLTSGNVIVVTYDGTTRSGFINGVASPTSPSTGYTSSPGGQTIGRLGTNPTWAPYSMTGELYWVSVYGSALSSYDRAILQGQGVPMEGGTAILDALSTTSKYGATGLYSLQRLLSTYTGPVVRVRRSTDNAEVDVFARKALNIDLGWVLSGTTFIPLSSWKAGTLTVTIWYDQSGNAVNAVQTTAADQPQLDTTNNFLTFDSTDFLTFSPAPAGPVKTGPSPTFTFISKIGTIPSPSSTFKPFITAGTTTTNQAVIFALQTSPGRYLMDFWNPWAYFPTTPYAAGDVVIASYDGTTDKGWKNGGSAVYNSPHSGTLTISAPAAQYIGRDINSPTRFFQASMYYLQVYAPGAMPTADLSTATQLTVT